MEPRKKYFLDWSLGSLPLALRWSLLGSLWQQAMRGHALATCQACFVGPAGMENLKV